MPPKPQLFLDISKANTAPQDNLQSSRYCRNHTNYVDLVAKLRNPTAAGPINKWMTTGQPVGYAIGAKEPKRRRPKLQRAEPEVTIEEYANFFEQDMSGSLSGSMGGYVAAKLTQSRKEEQVKKKIRENEDMIVLQESKNNELPIATEHGGNDRNSGAEGYRPYQKPGIKPCPYPSEIYKKNQSDEEYLALFASFEKPKGS